MRELLVTGAEQRVEDLSAGSPAFKGIRVVELSTVVAGPSAAQYLGALGAEVIKVESNKGDMWRDFAKVIQPRCKDKTRWSAAFDLVNRHKQSLQLDICSATGIESLLRLLSDADVFITNLKPGALQRNKLDLDSLRKRFPALVCAHVMAWGDGPLIDKPGYDTGCFWVGTSMQKLFLPNRKAHFYPIGFGDLSAGLALAAGIAIALTARLKSRVGATVSTSLFEVGLWTLGVHLNQCAPSSNAAYRHYPTADGEHIAICHPFDETADARLATMCEPYDIDAYFRRHPSHKLLEKLATLNLRAEQILSPFEFTKGSGELRANTIRVPFAEDIPCFVDLPMHFSISSRAHLQAPPKLGNMNGAFKSGSPPWLPRPSGGVAQLSSGSPANSAPLSGVTIVEFSVSASAAVAGACAICAGLGATVVRVLTGPSQKLSSATGEATWSNQLHGKKVSCDPDDMQSHMVGASLLVTDAPPGSRPKAPAGCSVIYFDASRTALGAWYAAAGLAGYMRGWNHKDDILQMPFQVVDLITSFSIFASMATALFHHSRLGHDAAQLVQSDFYRASLYQGMYPVALMQASPDVAYGYDPAAGLTTQDQLDCSPVPSVQPIQLRDGNWVLILGADLAKDLPKLLKSLGMLWWIVPLALTKLPAVICACGKRRKNKLLRLRPIFQLLNRCVSQAVGKMGSKEFSAWAARTNTHNFVTMQSVEDLLNSEHCKALKCLSSSPAGVIVQQPVKIVF